MRFPVSLAAIASLILAPPANAADWRALDPLALAAVQDDDVARHRDNPDFLAGLSISEARFSENGFDWHLLRFASMDRPDGPLWVVPHDDENAAFEAMIAAIKRHGGVGIAVNSGPGSLRRQSGFGLCGVRSGPVVACDPNRNFDARTPLFTAAVIDALPTGKPIIALHSNGDGFTGDGKGGRGDITMLDAAALRTGKWQIREDGYEGQGTNALLDDPDVYAILPYPAKTGISPGQMACRSALTTRNINVWHEQVRESDGSLSNYIALNRPLQAYVNFEAQRDEDLRPGAEAQGLMIDAFMDGCSSLWDKPVTDPVTDN